MAGAWSWPLTPLVVPWSWKGRAIPLLPLWAVRPVQSLSACTTVHFTFTFTLNVKCLSFCVLFQQKQTKIYIILQTSHICNFTKTFQWESRCFLRADRLTDIHYEADSCFPRCRSCSCCGLLPTAVSRVAVRAPFCHSTRVIDDPASSYGSLIDH